MLEIAGLIWRITGYKICRSFNSLKIRTLISNRVIFETMQILQINSSVVVTGKNNGLKICGTNPLAEKHFYHNVSHCRHFIVLG
jgi:hypothetical protein